MSEVEEIDGICYLVRYSQSGTKSISEIVEPQPQPLEDSEELKLLKKIAKKLGVEDE